MRHLSRPARIYALFARYLAPYWIASFGLFQVLVIGRLYPISKPHAEKLHYLLLGTAFPLAAILIQRAGVSLLPSARTRSFAKGMLSLAAIATSIYLLRVHLFVFLMLGAGQLLAVRFFHQVTASKRLRSHWPLSRKLIDFVCMLLPLSIAWGIAFRMQWWPEGGFKLLKAGSVYAWAIFLLAFVAVAAAAALSTQARAKDLFKPHWAWSVFFSLLIAFSSTYLYGQGFRNTQNETLEFVAYHHWGAIVAPAHFVRHGGWLLWDVPSQYGFLNALLLALPLFSNVWQALYICNGICLALCGIILFLLFKSMLPGLPGYIFSFVAAWTLSFFVTGITSVASGPSIVPSVGPFRFIWCYLLLALLAWDYLFVAVHRRGPRRTLWFGITFWLIGFLWSAESALFCTAIWMPANLLLLFRQYGIASKALWRLCIPWLALAAELSAICLFYKLRLGHLPDPRNYIDYIVGSSFFAYPINTHGAVAALLLVYLLVVTAVVGYLRRGPAPATPPVVLCAGITLFMICSYFVTRSHDANIFNLSPLIVACFLAALVPIVSGRSIHVETQRISSGAYGAHFYAAAQLRVFLLLMPILSSWLFLGWSNREGVVSHLHDMLRGYNSNIASLLPKTDPALQQLLQQADVTSDTPIAYFDNNDGAPMPSPFWRQRPGGPQIADNPSWLPDAMVLLEPLTSAQRDKYISRFANRSRTAGYLLRPNATPEPQLAWMMNEIEKRYIAGHTFQNSQWVLTYYSPR